MIRPLKYPNLPQSKVALCAVGEIYTNEILALKERGIEVIKTLPFPELAKPLRCHADLILHYAGLGTVLLAKEQELLFEKLKSRGLNPVFIDEDIDELYPGDCVLNAAALKDALIGRTDILSKQLVNIYKSRNYKFINVRQGYARCGTCIVSSKAIITEDLGIHEQAEKHGIDSLRINSGEIELPGFLHGFIGGASMKLSKYEIGFFGEIETHTQHNEIIAFLEKHKVKAISLRKGPLQDIGGAVILTESLGE